MRQVEYELGFDGQAPSVPAGSPGASTATDPRYAHASPSDGVHLTGFHLPTGRHAAHRSVASRGFLARLLRWRRPRSSALPLAIVTAFAGLTGAFCYNVLTDGGSRTRAAVNLLPSLDTVTDALGLSLEQATVTGHHFTVDSDVFDALELSKARSLLRFDSIAARERIERLPWVETASIARILFPGRIEVRITERTPFALWQKGDRYILVDRSGRELSAADPRDYATLPRFTGEGAPAEAAALLGLLQRYPLIGTRMDRAERVDGRRWTLRLNGNVVLHLPAEREALALEQVTQGSNIVRLIAVGGAVIDLRSPGRIAVRRAAERASASASRNGASAPASAQANGPVQSQATTQGHGEARTLTRLAAEGASAQPAPPDGNGR